MDGQLDLSQMPPAHRWSTERLASALQLTPRRINQLVGSKIIPRPDQIGHDPEKAIAGYLGFLRQSGSDNPSTNSLDRKVLTEAQLAEIKVARLKRELVSAEEIRQVWGKYIANCRSRLLSLPTKLAPVLLSYKTSAQVEGAIKTAIYDALQELSQKGLPEDIDDGQEAENRPIEAEHAGAKKPSRRKRTRHMNNSPRSHS